MLWAAAADLAAAPGPQGPPSNVSIYYTGGGTGWGIQWTNHDASYYTDITLDGDADPVVVSRTVGPGVAQRDMGKLPVGDNPSVRHSSGGEYSSWVTGLPT